MTGTGARQGKIALTSRREVENLLQNKLLFFHKQMYLVLSYVENAFSSFHDSAPISSAALANCPPFPSVISILCMAVPKGISFEVDSSFDQSKTLPKQ